MLRAFTVIVLIGLLAHGLSQILAQAPAPRVHFAETGLAVRGAFLDYFQTHGGLKRFGYPLSGELSHGAEIVQVFEYGALARSVDRPAEVRLLAMGERLGRRAPGLSQSEISGRYSFAHLYYPQTGHAVAFAFRDYYASHGGVSAFGYPISEPLVENGRIVQYFQGARLEWDTEGVHLGQLGEEYLSALGTVD